MRPPVADVGETLFAPAHRHPEVDILARIREIRWHHADDRPRIGIERNGLADDQRIAAEAIAPRAIAEDRDALGRPPRFIELKDPTERGANTKRREEVEIGRAHV